jgi:hypothetical protein
LFRLINKFLNLTWRERLLLIESSVLLGAVQLIITLLPFRWLAHYLGEQINESAARQSARQQDTVQKVGWGIAVINRCSPWKSKCLAQAVAAKIMLRRRKIASTLYLGVNKDACDNIIAHAWLKSGDSVVTGDLGKECFTVVATFTEVNLDIKVDSGLEAGSRT